MKHEALIREFFIENTIHLIALGGFEMATTRAIVHERAALAEVKLNEAYIYRLFGGKDQLFAAVFEQLDQELTSLVRCSLTAFREAGIPFRERAEQLFRSVWDFLLSDEGKCRCYVRYYHSVYFTKYSHDAHMRAYGEIAEAVSSAFKPKADVISLLHHTLTVMLDFAVRVYNGDLENSETNAEHIFNVIYAALLPYLKETTTPTLV
ncbi:MAG: TetR/AcrR family transcriptional regulator [Ruminococcaceae bacterium]|nr:TetR/AcrR family transcriptional regulator [Oscillospiraceae bacterium]